MSNEYKEYTYDRYGELVDIMCKLEDFVFANKKYYSKKEHYNEERLEVLNKIQSIIEGES